MRQRVVDTRFVPSFASVRGARWTGGLVALALTLTACQQRPAMVRTLDARHRASELAVSFTKASDATNRAVMALTDEASQAAALEARQASDVAQRNLDALLPLVQGLGYQPEAEQVATFTLRFAEYRALEARILDLAVENSNIKAQQLSFGLAADRADAVVAALQTVARAVPGDWRTRALVAEVTTAVRSLQAMEAPHIAEPADASMTRMEQRMEASEATVRQTLRRLADVTPGRGRTAVNDAVTAFDTFMTSHREILALSRRNTNVRSLALALNEKGKLTTTCDDILQAVLQGLDARTSYGTR